jgi:hypothetical protein
MRKFFQACVALILVGSALSAFAGPIDVGNSIIHDTANALIESKGPAESFTYGKITDDENNRDMFKVPALISDVTGLDFVPLATIDLLGGELFFYSTVITLPEDLPGRDEAINILSRRQLKYFERAYYESYFSKYDVDDPLTLSSIMAREVWEAFKAEYGDLPYSDPDVLADKYPVAREVSELTGIEILPISGIMVKGGLSGLSYFLTLLPEQLPGIDKAIKAVSKERKKAR